MFDLFSQSVQNHVSLVEIKKQPMADFMFIVTLSVSGELMYRSELIQAKNMQEAGRLAIEKTKKEIAK